ncbi:hypothetical protein, partial [Bradyrhizobium sp. NBAIM08]|uniref:hypothetical protein n=1 Tax=Bradyrhizobium sp. NBAIM08 TaxID=2793815 RepID=UPI001CD763B2
MAADKAKGSGAAEGSGTDADAAGAEGSGRKLDRAGIVAAALTSIDARGAQGLTMRGLGHDLAVEA